jgi:hypothetical protein
MAATSIAKSKGSRPSDAKCKPPTEKRRRRVDRFNAELAQRSAERKIAALPADAAAFRGRVQQHAAELFAWVWNYARKGEGGFRLSASDLYALQVALHEAEAIIEDASIVTDAAARGREIAEIRAPAVAADGDFQRFMQAAWMAAKWLTSTLTGLRSRVIGRRSQRCAQAAIGNLRLREGCT